MLLTVDVGNSKLVAGIWRKDALERSWRIHTVSKKTEDEYGTIFRSLFSDDRHRPPGLRRRPACPRSFRPSPRPWRRCSSASTGARAGGRGAGHLRRPAITVVNPYEVGADLVADAMAAFDKCGGACVVVDFGTALTFTIVDASGTMCGVAIAPGLGRL
jgi:type III pantothenate kinase